MIDYYMINLSTIMTYRLIYLLTSTASWFSYESSHNLLPRVYIKEDLPAPGEPQNPIFIEKFLSD